MEDHTAKHSMETTMFCCNNAIVIITVVFFFVCLSAKYIMHYSHGFPLILTYRTSNYVNKDTLYCAVCLQEAINGERIRRLPKCNHCFHVQCIDAWFQSHSTCPLCRNDVSFFVHRHLHCHAHHHLLPYFPSLFQFFLGKMFTSDFNFDTVIS